MQPLPAALAGAAFALPMLATAPAPAASNADLDASFTPQVCAQPVEPATSDIAGDESLDPAVRAFLAEINKSASPFWELPQPRPQEIISALQNKSPVDMSGLTTAPHDLTVDGRTVRLTVMTPDEMADNPGVILFIHGGVWIVGNFDNHKRLLRDLVVGSRQPAVFLEYTPLPEAKHPVQLEQAYAALEWIKANAASFGADGSRIAVAGNSVGGNMTAALTLMAKDRGGPKIAYQVLLWPATNAGVDTCSYQIYGKDRFLSRDFMKYGWDLYAPTEEERRRVTVSPLRASLRQLQNLPPALVITAESDVLRDEGEAYAHRLQNAGVAVVATRYNGTIHDFGLLNALADLPTTKAAIRQIAGAIADHIGGN